jgi:uncharacterized protein
MKKIVVCAGMLIAAIAGGCASQPAEAQIAAAPVSQKVTPAGDWHGVINRPPVGEIRLGLRIEATAPGAYSGVIINVDQGAISTPLAGIALADNMLSFTVPASGASFSGTWDAAARAWVGEYKHPAGASQVKFESGAAPPLPPPPPMPAVTGLDGRWEGMLQGIIPVVFRIKTEAAGTRAWMDSPSERVSGVPLKSLKRDGAAVTFVLPSMMTFEGELSAAGDKLTGKLSQAGRSMPVELRRVSADVSPVAASARPQTPKPPFPYRSEDVVLDNPASPGLRLSCTLTTPQGAGPHPAAVLISGSGPQNRDAEVLGHKTMGVLADHLTRRNIAVLRCDDRDFGKPPEYSLATTIDDFVSDVKAEIAFLRTRPEIDAKRIGVIGHSLGGVIGPRAAAEDPGVAFVVAMAGISVPIRNAIAEQRALMAQAAGATPAEVAEIRALWPGVFKAIGAAPDEAAARRIVRDALAKTPRALPPVYPTVDFGVDAMASKQSRSGYPYDPAPAFAKIKAPVLALNGSLDIQVSAKQNLDGFRKLLANHPDATVVELPGLNHAFQHARTGAMEEYADIEETFAPEALNLISDWLLKRVSP